MAYRPECPRQAERFSGSCVRPSSYSSAIVRYFSMSSGVSWGRTLIVA